MAEPILVGSARRSPSESFACYGLGTAPKNQRQASFCDTVQCYGYYNTGHYLHPVEEAKHFEHAQHAAHADDSYHTCGARAHARGAARAKNLRSAGGRTVLVKEVTAVVRVCETQTLQYSPYGSADCHGDVPKLDSSWKSGVHVCKIKET